MVGVAHASVLSGSFRSYPHIGQLLLLAVAAWAAVYGRFAIGPLQEAMRTDLALSDNLVALLQGPALALPKLIAAIPLGLLIDRYSRARLLLIFAGVNLAGSLCTALASSFAVLLIARCLTGLAGVAIVITAYSLIADLYASHQRGRATMVVAMGEIGGAPAAFALGGTLLVVSGAGPDSWRSALLWLSALLVPVVILMLALREPARTDVLLEKPSVSEVWSELWRYRAVIAPLLIARVMVWTADGAVLVWVAPTLSRRFALPPNHVGSIIATTLLVSSILGPIAGGVLADLCHRAGGPRRTMSVLSGLVLLSLPAALFAIMPGAVPASILLGVFLTVGFVIGTMAIALSTIVIPGELRGLYLSVSTAVGALFGIGLAPMLVSLLSDVLGSPSMIGEALSLVCFTTSLIGAAAFAFGRRYFPSKVAR